MHKLARPRKLTISMLLLGSAFVLLSEGASAQEDTASSVARIAQEAQASGLDLSARIPEGYMAQAAPGARSAQAAVAAPLETPPLAMLDRILPPEMDPITAEEVRRIDGEGVVGRRKKVGEDILLIERDLERAAKISDLVNGMGHEAFRVTYPDLYRMIEDSPIILKSRITQQEMMNDYLVALRGPEPAESPASETAAEPEVRADGSSYFELPGAVPPQVDEEGSGEIVEPPAVEDDETSPAQAMLEDGGDAADSDDELILTDVQSAVDLEIRENISLREVYGMGADRRAVILHGKDRIMIRVGDELPGRTTVKAIDATSIVILRDDEEMTIKLNG